MTVTWHYRGGSQNGERLIGLKDIESVETIGLVIDRMWLNEKEDGLKMRPNLELGKWGE